MAMPWDFAYFGLYFVSNDFHNLLYILYTVLDECRMCWPEPDISMKIPALEHGDIHSRKWEIPT